MKRSPSKKDSIPGEVISPLEHTHQAQNLTEPGEVLGTLNQDTPPKQKNSSQKALKERLEKPPENKREITIGPTTKTGPDITFDPR